MILKVSVLLVASLIGAALSGETYVVHVNQVE